MVKIVIGNFLYSVRNKVKINEWFLYGNTRRKKHGLMSASQQLTHFNAVNL